MIGLLKNNKIILALFFLAHAIFVFAYFGSFKELNIGNFFNSDTMYLPSLYKDFFIDGNPIEGTHFNPAPNLFPDMILYFVLMFITGGSVTLSSFIFAFIQYFLFFYLLNIILKYVFPNSSSLQISVMLIVNVLLLLEVFFIQKNFFFIYFLFSNSYHTGSFMMALVSLIMATKCIDQPTIKKYSIFFLIVLLSTFSDQLYLIQFVAPFILTTLIFIKDNTKQRIILILTISVGVVLSHYIFYLLENSGKIFFNKPSHNFTLEAALFSFDKFFSYMHEITVVFGYRTISLWLFVTSYILLLISFLKSFKEKQSNLKFILFFFIVYCPAVIFAALVTGIYTGYDTLRYNIYPLYLSGAFMIVFYKVFKLGGLNAVSIIKKPTLIISASALILIATNVFSKDNVKYFFNYYPETSRVIDSLCEKENLKCGVSNYWSAKDTRMFCKSSAKVYATFDNLAAYTHVANENWYFSDKQVFNFILVKYFKDTVTYKTVLKDYKVIYDCPDFKLIKTNDFKYKRETYSPYY